MKIYGISLIKNEIDIIEYSLKESSKWLDKIFVYDNGSTDGTWEMVNQIARSNDKVIPWKSEEKPYRDGLRADVYNEFKSIGKAGDWWCFILDCDEIYIDNPREFLPKVSSLYQVVSTERFEYKLTVEDVEEFQFHNHFPEDEKYINYYSPRTHSEKRFFRHRDRLIWTNDRKYPKHIGVICPEKIRLKHYQYRSPEQVKSRIKTRIQATKEGYTKFGRDNVDDWKDKLLPREELILETPEFKRDRIYDTSNIPWYWKIFRIFMHQTGLYP